MKNGGNSIKQGSATYASKDLSRITPRLEIITGHYRGPAHRNCNLRYKIPLFIPILFHNLSSYDAHVFIRELGKKFDKGKTGVIAENKEKYISFNVDVIVNEYVDDLGKVKEKEDST